MNRYPAFVLIAVLACLPATPVWAKGQTVRIEITGDFLVSPIVITDPQVLAEFSIWNGPGVGMRDPTVAPDLAAYVEPPGATGYFIAWSEGIATERPANLQRLEVALHVLAPGSPGNTRAMRFAYEPDPERGRGYIFLPMWTNDLIWHGVELNWLHAHARWNELILPLVEENTVPTPPGTARGALSCTVGQGSLRTDGVIEFTLVDAAGNRSSHWRYAPGDEWYPRVRDHIGDVMPGEEISVSCWPPRT